MSLGTSLKQVEFSFLSFVAQARNITKCEQYLQVRLGTGFIPDYAFVPICNANGNFLPVQCNNAINECWCVDENGRYIEGTEVEDGRPDCSSDSKCVFKRKLLVKQIPCYFFLSSYEYT